MNWTNKATLSILLIKTKNNFIRIFGHIPLCILWPDMHLVGASIWSLIWKQFNVYVFDLEIWYPGKMDKRQFSGAHLSNKMLCYYLFIFLKLMYYNIFIKHKWNINVWGWVRYSILLNKINIIILISTDKLWLCSYAIIYIIIWTSALRCTKTFNW